MGGPGSGRKGARRNPKGQMMKEADLTFTVVAEADGATAAIENLDATVDNLTMSFQQLDNNFEATSKSMNTYTLETDKAADATDKLEMETLGAMAAATMMVSGLNQLTGSLYKTIGGLEAAGLRNEEQARQLQEHARKIELLTGPLEFLISMYILYAGATALAGVANISLAGSFGIVTAAATSMALATAAAMAPLLVGVAIGLAVVAVFTLVFHAFKRQAEIIAFVKDGAEKLVSVFMQIATVGITAGQSVRGLGDALTDNPLSKSLLKAGAMF